MFYPRAVAVVGASARETQFNHGVVKGLRESGFAGSVYPVNPRLQELLGLEVYPSVADIPGPVDLVMIGVPAPAVMDVVHQCGRKGVAAMVVFTSGFAELGGDGLDLQQELVRVAHSYGMRFMGPNCFGLACAGSRLTYRSGVPLTPGRGALICQSGSMAWSQALLAAERGVFFDKTASIGNSADLDATDFLEYMGQDDRIDFISLYLEGIRDGQRFFAVLKETCRKKPVVLWKAGRSESGSQAAASHTAALSGEAHVFRAAARQAGALWCESLTDQIDLTVGLANIGVPRGGRIGVVSGPGAAGVAMADACEEQGLTLTTLGDATETALRAFLPPFASPRNPVDLTGAIFEDMTLYPRAGALVAADQGVDVLMLPGPSEIDPELFATHVAAAARSWPKPVAVPWIASDRAFEAGAAILRRAGVACFNDPARAAWTIARLLDYGRYREARGLAPWGGVPLAKYITLPRPPLASVALVAETHYLLEHEALTKLTQYGIEVPRWRLAASAAEAAAHASAIGFPVVLKIVSPDVPHKTEAGGVQLKIESAAAAGAAYEQIVASVRSHHPDAQIAGVLVAEQVLIEHELFCGVVRDPQFGPVIAFGLGGIFVEVLRDVSFGVIPMDQVDAIEMIRSIRGHAVIAGARGRRPVDENQLATILLAVARLAADHPDLAELDINPLAATRDGRLVALDCLIKLKS